MSTNFKSQVYEINISPIYLHMHFRFDTFFKMMIIEEIFTFQADVFKCGGLLAL